MESKVIILDRFKPRSYQIPIIDALENKGYKKLVVVGARRMGKDITAFNIMIRAALRKVGVYYYIFPTYAQAKKAVWDSITSEGMKFLDFIPEELIESKNSQEMKIVLYNGSLIQFIGSTDYDRLMGTNPIGCVFSEYALQDPHAYQYIRPILTANGGWALFISCVAPNTLIIGEKGLQRIKNVSSIRSEYSDLNKPIYGLRGFHNAEQFYYGGKQKTLKITLTSGYQIECTPIHPLWDGSKWIQAKDLKVCDDLPIQYGQDVWGEGLDISEDFAFRDQKTNWLNTGLDSDSFFYLLGLIHADGNYTDCCVCVTKKKDQQIIDFLHSLGFKTRPDGIHHQFCSKELCSILEHLDFKHGATNKTFPDSLFDCTKDQMRSFLQGLFDGDGCSASNPSKRGYVKLTSTNIKFMRDLQIVLLNFGIVSSFRKEERQPSKKVKVHSTIYNIEIYGYFAHLFYRDIGFRLERKQQNWKYVSQRSREESGNIYPIDASRLDDYRFKTTLNPINKSRITRRNIKRLNDHSEHPYLQELLKEKLFYSKIKSICYSENEVFDFVIPDTHSFFSNGFLSHNTPRGRNNFYDLYMMAKNSPDWYTCHLTVEDTKHITKELIQKEIDEGIMSEDLVRQEYHCDFNLGVEGGYYTNIIDKLSRENHITDVVPEVGYKVHTAWDLGMRDSTSIIFFQLINNTIRVVDFYENSGQSLEHYISYLRHKDYVYGEHIAPHDIRVRELTTGLTRYEKARQLGISFTIADNLSIMDGIEAVRTTLPKTWFDQTRCSDLLKHLENYRKEFDSKKQVYKDMPLHNAHSHAADAMRYLAIGVNKITHGESSPEELERRYREAMFGSNSLNPFS